MARDRPRLCGRLARRAWRPARQELHQRGLYPQHVRCLAGVHGAGGGRGVARRRCDPARRAPCGRRGAAAVTVTLAECEQLLILEARLLDEARFDDWLALFTPDAWYWVPSQPGQGN